MKKWLGLLVMVIAFLTCNTSAVAASPSAGEDVVVALGADLTAEQRATVLELMGLTEADLANCTVITITNEMEHQYLDSYLDASVIGSKSLSSVKLTKSEAGSGVLVTTKNISYCTTGMYRNALLTAGVEDMEVCVVAPSESSGTAGLIGALKAYEAMSGQTVPDTVYDTALAELITTGELAESIQSLQGNVSSEEVEALMAWLKGKVANGELDTGDEESIRDAIAEGEQKFGITLTEEEKKQIISLLKKLDSIGLDADYLMEQAQQLYEKYGLEIVENANEAINDAVESAVETAASNFIQQIKESITGFFKDLFSGFMN